MKTRKRRRLHALLLSFVFLMEMLAPSVGWHTTSRIVAAANQSGELGVNEYVHGGNLEVGKTYKLGGGARTPGGDEIEVTVLKKGDGKALLMSHGVYAGRWDTEKMDDRTDMTELARRYFGDMADVISDVRLPAGTCEDDLEVFWRGEYNVTFSSEVFALLKDACDKSRKLSPQNETHYPHCWLGNLDKEEIAIGSNGSTAVYNVYHIISISGQFDGFYTNNNYIYAPSFCIDLSRVYVKNERIHLFKESSNLLLNQSLKEIGEGESAALEEIVTDVSYDGGNNDGRSAAYRISCGDGRFGDDVWIAPENINQEKDVEMHIVETASGKNIQKTIHVKVLPREADHIEIVQKEDIRIRGGEAVDLADYISVKGYDLASHSDGAAQYHLQVDEQFGKTEGTVFTANNLKKTTEVPIKICVDRCGDVDYSSVSPETVTVRVTLEKGGYQDRDEEEDEEGFFTYTDPDTGISWHYRCNKDGAISFLYTDDDVSGTAMLAQSGILAVPSSIADIKVVGIGGGIKDGVIHPFIPADNNQWTRLYLPPTVTTINDGAFRESQAQAEISIPKSIRLIGVDAFFSSAIRKLTFENAGDLELRMGSFANAPNLSEVVVRGNGLKIGARAFENDRALEKVNLPKGTVIEGYGDDGAFLSATGIKSIRTNMARIEADTFPVLPLLNTVTFGANVEFVAYNWAGTGPGDPSVDRQTGVLNKDTFFSMEKTHGYSPFGYAGKLTVSGKQLDETQLQETGLDTEPAVAKVAWLARHCQEDEVCMRCAKGQAESIVFQIDDTPGGAGEWGDVAGTQTGIEAHYQGTALEGRKIDPGHMEVHRLCGEQLTEAYQANEFYIMRPEQFKEKQDQVFKATHSASGSLVAVDEGAVWNLWENTPAVTAEARDVQAGVLEVVVVVPQRSSEEQILLQPVAEGEEGSDLQGRPQVFHCLVTIPAKAYTAGDDMLEQYGSYDEALQHMKDMETEASEQSSLASDLQKRVDALDEAIRDKEERLGNLLASNRQLLEELGLQEAAVEDLTENSRELEKHLQEIRAQKEALQEQYDALENKETDEARQVLQQKEELARKEEEVSGLNDKIIELQSEKKTLLEEKESIQNEQKGILETMQLKEKELAETKQKLKDSEKKQSEDSMALASLKKELEAEKAQTAKKAQTTTKVSVTESTHELESANKTSKEVDALKKEMEALKTENQTLKSQVQAISHEKESLSQSRQDLEQKVYDTENKMAALDQKYAALKNKNESLNDKNEKLLERTNSLITKNDSLRSNYANLKKTKSTQRKKDTSSVGTKTVRINDHKTEGQTNDGQVGVGDSQGIRTKQGKKNELVNEETDKIVLGDVTRMQGTQGNQNNQNRNSKAEKKETGDSITDRGESKSGKKNGLSDLPSLSEQFELFAKQNKINEEDSQPKQEQKKGLRNDIAVAGEDGDKKKGKNIEDNKKEKYVKGDRSSQDDLSKGNSPEEQDTEEYVLQQDKTDESQRMDRGMISEVNAADFETEKAAATKKRSIIPLLIGGVFMGIIIAIGYMTMQGVSVPFTGRKAVIAKRMKKRKTFRKIS